MKMRRTLSLTSAHSLILILILAHPESTGAQESTHPNKKQKSLLAEPASKPRSTEWQLLPKQKWEIFNPLLINNKKSSVIISDRKVNIYPTIKIEPQVIPATDPLPVLGQIIGSGTESENLFTNDVVYIRSNGLVQVGDTYAITDTPEILKSTKSDRTGYSYIILGRVKVLAVRDDLFLGKIESIQSFAPRGTLLIANPPKYLNIPAIAASTAVQGTLLFDHRISTFASAQHKEVFIDRGSADGLKPGMILRVYQHYDPSNDKLISSSELIVDGELQVTQVSESFSTAMILRSYAPIIENSSAVLLTDLSDYQLPVAKRQLKGSVLDNKNLKTTNKIDPLEELDQLDQVQTIAIGEKAKLRQLEKWQSNPTITPIPTDPSSDSLPQPPPLSNESTSPAPEAGSSAPSANTPAANTPAANTSAADSSETSMLPPPDADSTAGSAPNSPQANPPNVQTNSTPPANSSNGPNSALSTSEAQPAAPAFDSSSTSLTPENSGLSQESVDETPSTATNPSESNISASEASAVDVTHSSLSDNKLPPPPPVPVKGKLTPLPPSAAVKTTPNAPSSESDLPLPPPPEL